MGNKKMGFPDLSERESVIFLGFIFKIVIEKFPKIGEAVAAVAN